MTRLFNNPASFVDEAMDGFAAVAAAWVRRVPGGVVRRSPSPEGSVVVVVGGGSGHYPAFAGLVGTGMAHGAVIGQVFASPSADQAYEVARACQAGGGILFLYGNYAGDVLNFDQAQARLRSEGFDCRSVVVTDDILSAPEAEAVKRRGIAGDLVVFKVASAAADRGASLDDVERLARLANERTRSVGVAFGGCTLPGAAEPLFTVASGRMAVGMGIHGEPGLSEVDMPSANGVAEVLMEALLAETPPGVTVKGSRAVVLLNGLGSVKYEELFVVYSRVAGILAEAGVLVVEPEVGELVTSFDMAGLSLTVTWLDDELEALWRDPASSPAFKKVPVTSGSAEVGARPGAPVGALAVQEIRAGSAESRQAAIHITTALDASSAAVELHVSELGRLDAVAGDGDHGIGMQRGAGAAAAEARATSRAGAGVGTVLSRAGRAWANAAGGTSGALWGLALQAAGDRLGDDETPDAASALAALDAATAAIHAAGHAQIGDKTMVDALVPLLDTVRASVSRGDPGLLAWSEGARAATTAAARTADLLPLVGRARPHAQRSLGSPDPGAVSLALVVTAAVEALMTELPQEYPHD